MRKRIGIFVAISLTVVCSAQRYTLADCRQLALEKNIRAEIDREGIAAAKEQQHAAVARFFPHVSLNGMYEWNQNNLYLLPDEAGLGLGPNGWQQLIPGTGQQAVDRQMGQALSEQWEALHELSEIDIHHVMVGVASVAQPVFLGGKLIQAEKMAKSEVRMMEIKSEKDNQDLVVEVDEAFWRVLTVESKKQLAEQYLNLLRTLEHNVTELQEAGLATESDLLKVRVKRQEAEMKQLQAANGLVLSKMALCQLCGLDLQYDIQLDDRGLYDPMLRVDSAASTEERHEVQLLEEAQRVAHAGVMLSASSLMPNVMAHASYVLTNPSATNGINTRFGGGFTAGVVVNVPLAHADDICHLRAAKHREEMLSLELKQVQQKLQLQVKQSAQAVELANAKLVQAEASIRSAEENLRYANESFEAGLIDATDVMMAQTAWMQACSARIEAAGEARLAEVTYLQHSGQLRY